MSETTETIGQWAKDTFPGADPTSPRKALRLLEEVVELCFAAGATPSECTIAVGMAARHQGWDERLPDSPDEVAEEMADCNIVLRGLAHLRGVDLDAETDAKMKTNRARSWNLNGDGTGYHKKP